MVPARTNLLGVLIILLASHGFFFIACNAENDDGQSDDNQNNADDDQSVDDDAATDDDQQDDDSDGLRIRLLAGGAPGANGNSVAAGLNGEVVAAAVVGRYLTIYRITGGQIHKETTGIFAIRPNLAIDPNGDLHVCYLSFDGTQVGYATNATGVWQTEVVELAGRTDAVCAIAADQDGYAHLTFATFAPQMIHYATNRSGDWVHETVDQQGSADLGLSIAVDSERVALSYYNTQTYKLTLAQKASGSWSSEPVAAVDYSCGGPSAMALGADNDVHFAFVEFDDETDRWTLFHAEKSRRDWVLEAVDSWTDTQRIDPRYVGIAVDGDGVPHAMYDQPTAGEIRHAVKSGNDWQTETAVLWGPVSFNSMAFALQPAGDAHIVYYGSNTTPPFRYATNADGQWQSVILDPAGTAGAEHQLAIEGDGTISIVYLDQSTRQLLRLFGQGEDWTTEVIDSGIDLYGPFFLLATDEGLFISYVRRNPGTDWRLIVANNTTGEWRFEVVQKTPSTYYCGGGSMAAGPDGRVYLAYCTDELKWAVRNAGDWRTQAIAVYPYPEQTSLAVDAEGQVHLTYLTFTAIPYPDPFLPTFIDLMYYLPLPVAPLGRQLMGVLRNDQGQMSPTALALDPQKRLRVIFGRNATMKLGWLTDDTWDVREFDAGSLVCDPTAVYDADSHVHAAFFQDDSYDLYYVTDLGGSLRQTLIDGEGVVGQYPSMVLDQQGTVHITYFGESALWYATFPAGYTGP